MIRDIIRGEIGYTGALMTDDLGMKALQGSFKARAERSLEAGCDLILHCSGVLDEMRDIAAVVPELSGQPLQRYHAAVAQCVPPQPFDRREAETELNALLSQTGARFESLVA